MIRNQTKKRMAEVAGLLAGGATIDEVIRRTGFCRGTIYRYKALAGRRRVRQAPVVAHVRTSPKRIVVFYGSPADVSAAIQGLMG